MFWQNKLKSIMGRFLVILALGGTLVNVSSAALTGDMMSSVVNGGRLYDNWYREVREHTPDQPHPAYPETKKYANDPAANWRCKECHGWDYLGKDGAYGKGRHFTGIKGIRGMAGADKAEIIAVLKDNNHRYGGLINRTELEDLASFVSTGQVNMDKYIDRATGMAKGDKVKHRAYYTTICANCHGKDGLKIGTIPSLGEIARSNPWEVLHKIMNGHPGEVMPALRVLPMTVLVGVLAYVQNLPEEDLLSSITRGGRLYDNWLKEKKIRTPKNSRYDYRADWRHPAYPTDKAYAKEPRTNWRCKECHGWDYLGKDGAYSTGRHFTGITGIRGRAGEEPTEIITVLKDQNHRYDGLLTNRDLNDLANFVSDGQIDMDNYIERTSGKAKGNAKKNSAYYSTICANCHGSDGLKVTTMHSLGYVARKSPWKALHIILNGHPDEKMPALRVLSSDTLAGILAHIQTLPGE